MKIWKLAGITFIFGVATGAGSLSLYNWMQVDPGDYASTKSLIPGSIDNPDSETTKLLARIAEQRGEIQRLKSQLEDNALRDPDRGDRNRGDREELTEEEIEQRRAERREEMRERFAAEMQKREEKRIQELVDRYGLTEAQRQLLVTIFQQQRDNFAARRSGEEVEPFNLDEAFATIMTEDQYARYLEDTQNQIYNRATQMAQSQVAQVAGRLKLNEDQQSMLFEAINYTAQEMMIARQAGEDYAMREIMSERLSSILTPQQLEAYQQIISRDGRDGRDGRPGGGGRLGGGGGGRPEGGSRGGG